MNLTWLLVAAVYAASVWLARRGGMAELRWRIAALFYALVLLFLWEPMTQQYVNIPVDFIQTLPPWTHLTRNHHVWNAELNDVGKMRNNDLGIWDAHLYDLESVYDLPFSLDKAQRLALHDTQMTHAMLFTGVDVVDGSPRKWRVENSWGDEKADKGFWTMNDNWFDEHVFEIAAPRDQLSPELLVALEAEPIVLPAWDPMGALAR